MKGTAFILKRALNLLFKNSRQAVTLRSYTTSRDDYHDTTETESDTSTYAIVSKKALFTDRGFLGELQEGTYRVYFKPDETKVVRGNRIIINSTEYEIDEVVERREQGTLIYIMCVAKTL